MTYTRTFIFEIPDINILNNELDWGVLNRTEVKNIIDNWDIKELQNFSPKWKLVNGIADFD